MTSTCASGGVCTNYKYDANGNMETKVAGGVTTAYTYDAENRLTKVTKNGSTIAQYEYDGDGGRTKKTATINGVTTTTTFVGSLFESDSKGRSTKYIFLGDQRVASITPSPTLTSNILYYHADHLGGANVLSNVDGTKKELIEYEPFGGESRHEKYGSSEEIAWYYFTGKPKDDESGLYYYGARYYDPSLGRFITPDSVVQDPYDPQTLNRYSYTSNNPINRVDLDGHKWSWKNFWKAAVAAVVSAVVFVATGGTATPVISGFWAGMAGGAVAGGLSGGGWQAVLQGAAFGAVTGAALGGIGAWGVDKFGAGFGWGMLAAGGGYSAATGNLDSFAGGLTGAVIGTGISSFLTTNSTSSSSSSSYNHLSSNEIPDPIDGLARIFNDIRKNPIEKAIAIQALPREVNKTITLSEFIQMAKFDNDLIGVAGLALLMTPAAPIGVGIIGGSGLVGAGLSIAEGVLNGSYAQIGWAVGKRAIGGAVGSFAVRAAGMKNVIYNSRAARWISNETGRFATNIYGKTSIMIEKGAKALFGVTVDSLAPR